MIRARIGLQSKRSRTLAQWMSNQSVEKIPTPSMDAITSLCKRRGFIFPSGEIYNSIAGFFDYGHLGVELKNNIKKVWWQDVVYRRADMIGMDSSIISSPSIWAASGHIDKFSDPFVDCKESRTRFRADQVHWAAVEVLSDSENQDSSRTLVGYVCIAESQLGGASSKKQKDTKDATGNVESIVDAVEAAALKSAKKLVKQKGFTSNSLLPLRIVNLMDAPSHIIPQLPSPATGSVGVLTPPRQFNLMFHTSVGAVEGDNDDDEEDNDSSSGTKKGSEDKCAHNGVAYLRPETAQGIFTNFQNMQKTSRQKLPFGIAQIGKAFRNEITPRNYIFRSREFEMMEIEYFIPPDDHVWQQHMSDWLEWSWKWLIEIGLREELLSRKEHVRAEDGTGLAHYAKACTDIEFKFPFGQNELMGVAARGSYDLDQHGTYSGKSMEYQHVPSGGGEMGTSNDETDVDRQRKYVPHVIEPSMGLDRLILAVLTSAYREDVIEGETRTVLSLHPAIAPVKACVLPLRKSNPEVMQIANEVFAALRESGEWNIEMDLSGSVGKRYRRADEVGTPFCITVDTDSVEDSCVTVRHRDSTEQERVPIVELRQKLAGYLKWR